MMQRIQFRAVAIALAGIAVGAAVMLLSSRPMLNTFAILAMYVALTSGWSVLGGYGGYLNLGMAGFFGIGAYAGALVGVSTGFAPWITMPVATLVAVLVALVIGVPTLRLRGPYFGIITLLLTFVAQLVAYNFDFTKGASGITVERPELSPKGSLLLVFAVYYGLALVTVVGMSLFDRSSFAHRLRAIREDEDGAEILGVDTNRAKLVALMVGAGVAGAAGSVYAWQVGFVEPSDTFTLTVSINVLVMAILGGTRYWYGALIGVPIVVLLDNFLQTTAVKLNLFGPTVPQEFNQLMLGLLLLIMALYFKKGVAGIISDRRAKRSV
jgi:branched-chain amino acid transport system permease protein